MIHLKKFNNWFVNYFHFSKNRRSSINFNSCSHKWRLSKISWKKFFVDMLTFLKTLFFSIWEKKNNSYYDLQFDVINDLTKRHNKIVKQMTKNKSMIVDDFAIHQIIVVFKNLFLKFMIRRTNDFEMFNRRVVNFFSFEITWVSFITSFDLKNRIVDYRKFVVSREKTTHRIKLTIWVKVNRNKSLVQQISKSLISNNNNRIHFFNHVLRVLIDFSYLIHFVYDNDENKIENCFTLKDIKTRQILFLNQLKKILDWFSKYHHLLNIFENIVEKNFQSQNKFVIESVFLMIVFLIKSINLSFFTNKNYWLHSCSSFYWCDFFIFEQFMNLIYMWQVCPWIFFKKKFVQF